MNYRILIVIIIMLCFLFSCDDDQPTNPDNTYTSVTICGKVWMNKNLNVDHYSNGDKIPEVTDPSQWATLKTGAWCYYNNDSLMGAIYGKLYNWYAVNDSRGLAPNGWHIPSTTEWNELENCLGGDVVAGGKLKSTGTVENNNGLWLSPNTGASNETGFSGLPGGYRANDGIFYNSCIGSWGFWWSSSSYNSTLAWSKNLYYCGTNIGSSFDYKENGYSIRCIKN